MACAVIRLNPFPVLPTLHRLHPFAVSEVPVNGAVQSLTEGDGLGPGELAFDFGTLNSITAVMSRSVGNEGNEILIVTEGPRAPVVHDAAELSDQIDVLPLVLTAQTVGFARRAVAVDRYGRWRTPYSPRPPCWPSSDFAGRRVFPR